MIVTWKIHLPYEIPKMGRIFARCWMHGYMRPIRGNFEGRWIFQVTLIKKGLYTVYIIIIRNKELHIVNY